MNELSTKFNEIGNQKKLYEDKLKDAMVENQRLISILKERDSSSIGTMTDLNNKLKKL
jgi:hypothetical protein